MSCRVINVNPLAHDALVRRPPRGRLDNSHPMGGRARGLCGLPFPRQRGHPPAQSGRDLQTSHGAAAQIERERESSPCLIPTVIA
eukprot:scaffold40997_cov72-Phaeocystis_antarctica.AAC.5